MSLAPCMQVLVLEYLKGGQLLDHLHTIGEHYTEQQAAALFAQVRCRKILRSRESSYKATTGAGR